MPKYLFIFLVPVVLFIIFLLYFLVFYNSFINYNNVYEDRKINIFEDENKKIVENKNYNFDLILNKDSGVSGYDEFIEISNKECVLNFSSSITDKELCDYIKDECDDLGCKTYTCEKYKNNWYKVIEEGDFFGTGDKILAYKNNGFVYFLNLECKNMEDDVFDNLLFEEAINGLRDYERK